MTPAELFETRKMMSALEQRKAPRTFFLDMFFRNEDVSDSEHIEIDIDRGGQRIMAAFVNPILEGKAVDRRGFKVRSYKPPYVKPFRVCTAEDVLRRGIGETVYGAAKSPAQRAAELVGKDLGELDDMILRREEWMAATGLTTGNIIVQGDGVNDLVSFDMLPSHLVTLSGNSLWSASTTATPLANLLTWTTLVQKDSGLVPKDVIMGRSAFDSMLRCSEVTGVAGGIRALFDMRNVNMGVIAPRQLPGGVKYMGYLADQGLDIWTYDEWFYNDKTGVSEPMMPTNKVLIGCTDARCIRHYGLIRDLKSSGAVRRFPKSWEQDNPSARFIMVQSAPLPAPHQIDAFLCATVI